MTASGEDEQHERTDIFSPEKRSEVMSKIGPKDSEPEKLLRSLLHREGYRFGLHRKSLPGSPDLSMPKHGTVIFMHGCFWHRHSECRSGTNVPKSNTDYWKNKFANNVKRDARVRRELEDEGWDVIVVWECELKDDPFSTVEDVIRRLES